MTCFEAVTYKYKHSLFHSVLLCTYGGFYRSTEEWSLEGGYFLCSLGLKWHLETNVTTRKGLVPPPRFFRLSQIILLEVMEEAGGCTGVSRGAWQASPGSETWAGLWCPLGFPCSLLSSPWSPWQSTTDWGRGRGKSELELSSHNCSNFCAGFWKWCGSLETEGVGEIRNKAVNQYVL